MYEWLKVYLCLMMNFDEVFMFYIFFYYIFDLVCNLYLNDILVCDCLGQKFVEWFCNQVLWQCYYGQWYVFVLGCIYWDFCWLMLLDLSWGSNFVMYWEFFNVMKLLIE